MKPHIVKMEYSQLPLDLFDFLMELDDVMDIYFSDSSKRVNTTAMEWFERFCIDYLEKRNVVIFSGGGSYGYLRFNINGVNIIISLYVYNFGNYELDSLSRLFGWVKVYRGVR